LVNIDGSSGRGGYDVGDIRAGSICLVYINIIAATCQYHGNIMVLTARLHRINIV
jgi:hypothetical protein